MSKDTQPAMTYPTVEQYEAWKRRAGALDMSVSGYMKAMIEAGHKKFEASTEPDETNQELREQRNALRKELANARERIVHLEDRLADTEREQIAEFVRENPGASWADIDQHINEKQQGRVNAHLEALESEKVRKESEGYYPVEVRQ